MIHLKQVVLSMAIAAGIVGEVGAQCGGWLTGPDQAPSGPDDTVYSSVMWDPDGDGPEPKILVLGGQFKNTGRGPFGSVAGWDGSYWRPVGDVPCGLLSVRELLVIDDTLYACGWLDSTTGAVTRLRNGEWEQVGDSFDDLVGTMAVWEGDLLAGGAFVAYGAAGIPMPRIARWNGVTWEPFVSACNGGVWELRPIDGQLYAGGLFTSIAGVAANRVAAWNGISWSPLGDGIGTSTGSVLSIAMWNGDLYAGGKFDASGATTVTNIARWNGATWSPLADGLPSSAGVRELLPDGQRLLAGGGASTMGSVAAWDGASWSTIGPINGTAYAIEHNGDRLHVGGAFTVAGPISATNFVTLESGVWSATPDHGGLASGSASACVVFGGKLIATGSFNSAGGIPVSGIAAWNGRGWEPFEEGLWDSCSDFCEYEGSLIAAGRFSFPGEPNACLARWDGASWNFLSAGAAWGCGRVVNFRGNLIASGDFSIVAGSKAKYVARWDGIGWSALGSGLNGSVDDLFVHDDQLYVGGRFTQAGGASAKYVARWDGVAWHPLGSGVSGGIPYVYRLGSYQGDLIVGGEFTTAGGQEAGRIARWDGVSWHPLGSGVQKDPAIHNCSVEGMLELDGSLYVNGMFAFAGGAPASNFARWDGVNWHPVGAGLTGAYGLDMTYFNGEIIAVGRFHRADGVPSQNWARYSPSGAVWIAGQPASGGYRTGDNVSLVVQPAPGYDAADPLNYAWSKDGAPVSDGPGGASAGGGVVSGSTTGTLTISSVQLSDAGSFVCEVSNQCGAATSQAAQLDVTCGADHDGSGFVDTDDFTRFVLDFELGIDAADFDRSGFVDLDDFHAFIVAFEAGC